MKYADRGVGMLHIKKCDGEKKIQLIVRTTNATGMCVCVCV
jgi:hypothetical protein